MIRVVIDGAALADPYSRGRGFGRYVQSLLTSLPQMADLQIGVLVLPGTELPPGVTPIPIRRFNKHALLASPEHLLRLGLDVARARPDVFHGPTNEPPIASKRPVVQTLHDIIPLLASDPGFRWERKLWRLRAFAMRRADRVICISRWAADCGIRYLGLRADRIRVIYHGVTPIFAPSPVPPMVADPYFLFVSEYAAGKGYPEVFEVMRTVAASGEPHSLKVAGRLSDSNRPAVERMLAESGCRDRVELLGYVPDEELAALYRGATALLFTSRREGFGRPPIEAMASGTPIICFDNTSLPEIVGDSGILIPDGDTRAFAESALRLIRDDGLRADMSARALGRVRLFDWNRCASEHAEVYRSLAG